MQLEGKTALVTGGGRGIGRSIALAYAKEGADVAVVSRTESELDEVTDEIRALGRKGLGIIADLTKSDEASGAVRKTIEAFGTVDILVNNAGGYRLFTNGLSHQVSVADITEEEWQRVMHSNVTTTFLTCKAVLPHMMERGRGAIINLTS
ncbi:MAG: SDR family NAD(P)-dependent oxidoreductase, partial [Dehalococcoidia bacterium]